MSIPASQSARPIRTGRVTRDNRRTIGVPRAAVSTVRALLLLLRTPMTRADLAAHIGVHWRTVYRVVEDLREAGVRIVESGGGGPRPSLVSAHLPVRIRRF